MNYCDTCNASHDNSPPRIIRCGTCAIINGKVPPTKYMPTNRVEVVTDPAEIMACFERDYEGTPV